MLVIARDGNILILHASYYVYIQRSITVQPITVSEPSYDVVFEMICDTPFVFISHRNTRDCGRQILFLGVVNQP